MPLNAKFTKEWFGRKLSGTADVAIGAAIATMAAPVALPVGIGLAAYGVYKLSTRGEKPAPEPMPDAIPDSYVHQPVPPPDPPATSEESQSAH